MKKRKLTLSSILMWLPILWLFLPFYVMIVGGFKFNTALMRIPPNMNPLQLITANYKYVMTKMELPLYFYNSTFISVFLTLITLLIASTAGYAFAKKQFAGRSFWFAVLLATMMLPRQILMVPNFMVAKNFGLVEKLMGVVLTSIAAPFGVFLCKQFISTLPDELLEAAQIDGSSELNTFSRIILPLSMPVLGALSIFCFITGWNDFVWQNVMLTSKAVRTLPLAIAHLSQEEVSSFGYQLAGATLSSIPMITVFLIFQKYFIKGITVGAVKG